MHPRSRPGLTWPLLALFTVLLAAAPNQAPAQDTGTIRGTVLHDATLQPAVGAQVSILGTGRGALTNGSGEFLILNVPAGSQTLTVEMMGFACVLNWLLAKTRCRMRRIRDSWTM